MSTFMTQTVHTYNAAASSSPKRKSRNSGAFGASAKPDEDWTKISDLTERRRIQNRIAQRNYRKKLKQRREDLERLPDFSDAESKKPQKITKSERSSSRSRKPSPCAATKPIVSQGHFTHPMEPAGGDLSPEIYGSRARCDNPTQFAFSTYLGSDKILLDPNGPAPDYTVMTTDGANHNNLVSIVPTMFSSVIHGSAAFQCRPYPADRELALSTTYPLTPPTGVDTLCPYDQSNFHVPSPSDSSSVCSEAGYEYLTVPLPMRNRSGPIHLQRENKDYICNFHLSPVEMAAMAKTWFAIDHDQYDR